MTYTYRKALKQERGASSSEYALVLLIFILIAVAAFPRLEARFRERFKSTDAVRTVGPCGDLMQPPHCL